MASSGSNIQHTEIDNIIREKFGNFQNFYSSDWWRKIKTIPMYSEINNVADIQNDGELNALIAILNEINDYFDETILDSPEILPVFNNIQALNNALRLIIDTQEEEQDREQFDANHGFFNPQNIEPNVELYLSPDETIANEFNKPLNDTPTSSTKNHGGRKRKTNKCKLNKRKTNKRKLNKRKTNKRKTNKRKLNK
jgi:hypothetical protein